MVVKVVSVGADDVFVESTITEVSVLLAAVVEDDMGCAVAEVATSGVIVVVLVVVVLVVVASVVVVTAISELQSLPAGQSSQKPFPHSHEADASQATSSVHAQHGTLST